MKASGRQRERQRKNLVLYMISDTLTHTDTVLYDIWNRVKGRGTGYRYARIYVQGVRQSVKASVRPILRTPTTPPGLSAL